MDFVVIVIVAMPGLVAVVSDIEDVWFLSAVKALSVVIPPLALDPHVMLLVGQHDTERNRTAIGQEGIVRFFVGR